MPMLYADCLKFLYQQLPMYQRVGAKAIKKDLRNTLSLLQALGDPQKRFASIHVAGTNGKGSVCHLLSAVLQTQGYRVGLYTSPHYFEFRERIKINGYWIEEYDVVNFVQRVQPLIEEIKPSFFELTVAMAFDYFARQGVDFAVVETGLGGRLDSTNVLHPILSVITNIGLDHQDMLGDTMEQIAKEKAGIIKPTVPVVVGENQEETAPVFTERARYLGAQISFAEDEVRVLRWTQNNLNTHLVASIGRNVFHVRVGLGGRFQLNNAVTTLAAINALDKQGVTIHDSAICIGLANVKTLTSMLGRWQVMGEGPQVIVDSGHNPAALRQYLPGLYVRQGNVLRIVFGVSQDKAVDDMLALLPTSSTIYWCKAQLPRSKDPDDLAREAQRHGLSGQAYESAVAALRAALDHSDVHDVVLVGGSTFVVGEVLEWYNQ